MDAGYRHTIFCSASRGVVLDGPFAFHCGYCANVWRKTHSEAVEDERLRKEFREMQEALEPKEPQ